METMSMNNNDLCRCPGCSRAARSRRSVYCEKHNSRNRRHGDPQQSTVTRKELQPYIEFIERLIKKETTGKLEEALKKIRGCLFNDAKDVEIDYSQRGKALPMNWLKAHREIMAVFRSTDWRKPAVLLASLFLLQYDKPHRIASDRGFIFEAARLFRSLSPQSVGSYWNHRTGKVHKVYKDMSPRAVNVLGTLLVDAYAPWMGTVKQQWDRQRKQQDEIRQLLSESMESI
jgi:hypothetical protein